MAGGRCLSARGLLHASQLFVEASQGVMQSGAPPSPALIPTVPPPRVRRSLNEHRHVRELGALEFPIAVLAWRKRIVLVTEMLSALGGRCWFDF
jgi:hypothetical protein